jgi:hypothetical protein
MQKILLLCGFLHAVPIRTKDEVSPRWGLVWF